MNIKSPEQLTQIANSDEFVSLVTAVFVAKAKLAAITEKVDEYRIPYFKSFGFLITCAGHPKLQGKPIEHPDRLAFQSDPECEETKRRMEEYYMGISKLHQENGFDIPDDYCPINEARLELIEQERKLVGFMLKQMGLPTDRPMSPPKHDQLLELSLKLGAPNVKVA